MISVLDVQDHIRYALYSNRLYFICHCSTLSALAYLNTPRSIPLYQSIFNLLPRSRNLSMSTLHKPRERNPSSKRVQMRNVDRGKDVYMGHVGTFFSPSTYRRMQVAGCRCAYTTLEWTIDAFGEECITGQHNTAQLLTQPLEVISGVVCVQSMVWDKPRT